MSVIACASATWAAVTLLRPMWRISPLAPEVGQHGDLLGDGPLLGAVARPHHAVVDDVERVQAQVAEIVVDAGGQFLGRDGRLPRPVGRAAGPQLGDDDQPCGIGVQGLPDDLVGDVRAVEVAGVDVVDAGSDGFAQNGDGASGSLGGPQTPGPASCIAP